MNNPFVRWWVTFSVIMVTLITALAAGIGEFIYRSDQTYISWGIIAVYLIGSLALGKVAHRCHRMVFKNEDIEDKASHVEVYFKEKHLGIANYCVETLTSLGLLGTIIGLILMVVGAFADLDISNQQSVKESLVAMASGVGTALVTTLVGLVTALLLRFNILVTKGG